MIVADVSRETQDALEHLVALVQKWSPKINLVSRGDLSDLWGRHIRDSLQLWSLTDAPPDWLDLGSGGGFPALPISIAAKNSGHRLEMTCIESDQRKSTFLRTAARELGLNVSVITERIEAAPPQDAHCASARALASLSDLLDFAAIHLKPTGRALFPKGASWENEVAVAREHWNFTLEVHPSHTSPDARILICSEISRA